MIVFNWTIEKLFVKEVNGQHNYVVSASYAVTATEDTYFSIKRSIARFSTSSTSVFIPFVDVKESDVVDWIQQGLGVEQIGYIYASLEADINTQKNPPAIPVRAPLPWNKSL